MPVTNTATGEVRPVAVAWPELRARAERLRNEHPEVPAQVDRLMRQIEDLAFELADFLVEVNNERYDAEVAYSNRRNAALAKHGATQRSVTVAKALADADAETEHRDWLAKKSIYHHVEGIAKALSTKHYGLMNTNKGIQAMVGSGHRRAV